MADKKANISVIAAGVLWGLITIFIKKLSSAGLDALQISAIRLCISAPVFLAFILITDRSKIKIKLRDIWMFVCTGIVSVVLFNTCYFYTMIHSQASVAVVLLYTSPVFIMILSAVFFKERITARKICALLLTVGGCCLAAGITQGFTISPFIFLTGLASGLFYGLYTIFGRIALNKYDTRTVTLYTFLLGMPGSMPTGKIPSTIHILSGEPALIFWCVGIAVVSTVLPYFLYTTGLKKTESGKAAVLVAVEPVVGAVLGMAVYGEPCYAAKLAGITAIIAAIIILNTGNNQNTSEAET